jgi:hypothetical protein
MSRTATPPWLGRWSACDARVPRAPTRRPLAWSWGVDRIGPAILSSSRPNPVRVGGLTSTGTASRTAGGLPPGGRGPASQKISKSDASPRPAPMTDQSSSSDLT